MKQKIQLKKIKGQQKFRPEDLHEIPELCNVANLPENSLNTHLFTGCVEPFHGTGVQELVVEVQLDAAK